MAPIVRKKDWEGGLADYLAEHRHNPFAWGRHDCVLFAAGAVAAMTGVDPAAEARGRYATRIGSLRVLHRMGWRDLETMMDAYFDRIAPAFAQRGDAIMADRSLGICAGRFALFVGDSDAQVPGLVERPLADWSGAWRVPLHG